LANGVLEPIVICSETLMENEEKPENQIEQPAEQAEDEVQPAPQQPVDKDPPPVKPHLAEEDKVKPAIHHRFWHWYIERKKWTIAASILLVILLIALIPWTRYKTAGLVLSKNAVILIKDSEAGTPVSGAVVHYGSGQAETDASGHATMHSLKVGPHKLTITKKYYKDGSAAIVVPILKTHETPEVKLTATGRQLKIKVTDFVNGSGLKDVVINLAGASSQTDKNGEALVIAPAGSTTEKASLSLDGYNSIDVTVKISDSAVVENDFKLVASGKVYFLSKLSGSIDIVKTNLDGSSRETVAAGTGKEEDTNTVLLASRDWKYLALLAKRDSNLAKLYVMSTDDDKLLGMDQGDADFTPVGWYNHFFIYTVARHGYSDWQPNAFSVKSYNAETGQTITLVNSNASGSSTADAEYEAIFNTLLVGNDLIYTRTWYKYPGYLQVPDKQDVLAAIHPDGSNSRQLKTVDANNLYFSNLKLDKPRELDFGIYSNNSSDTNYYVLDKNGNISESSSITDSNLLNKDKTYLASPSGRQTFWQEERDGKNTLFIGDQDAGGAKQIATLSGFSAYGWYSDDYLLVSKNGSELYIISKNGVSDDSKAVKISDYHKPARNFYGYGGGYGGI
jgi:hypothetical protein